MELIKDKWTKNDIKPFQEYLKSFSKGEEKSKWEGRIVNTNMPCIAVPSEKVHEICKQICKGNYLSFVELWIWENHTNTIILAIIISKIKDFYTQKFYLRKLAENADNWSTIDSIKIKPTEQNKDSYFEFASNLIDDPKPFVRRLGLIILLKLSNFSELADKILKISDSFADEKHYYVNMANAWLVCEMYIKHRNNTLPLLKAKTLNTFTQNKAISKCRDSFRVSKTDKEMLLEYKK